MLGIEADRSAGDCTEMMGIFVLRDPVSSLLL